MPRVNYSSVHTLQQIDFNPNTSSGISNFTFTFSAPIASNVLNNSTVNIQSFEPQGTKNTASSSTIQTILNNLPSFGIGPGQAPTTILTSNIMPPALANIPATTLFGTGEVHFTPAS